MITWEKPNYSYPVNQSQPVQPSQGQNMDHTVYNQRNESNIHFNGGPWSNSAPMAWYKHPKVEPGFSSGANQSPCPSPGDSVTFLSRSEAETKQNYAPFPVLPLSPDDVDTLSTIVRDPSFASCVANAAQNGLLQDIQNLVTYQEHSELNQKLYHNGAFANLRGRKRTHSCSGDSDRDEMYWEKRRKNNASAKKSRDAKRRRELLIKETAIILEEENKRLRMELSALKDENKKLKDNAR